MKKILTLVLTALCCTAVLAQTRVTGTVTAADDGTPVSFATIAVKGSTNLITTTDMDGRFTFANIPGNAVLIISYIGYTTQEIAVNNRTIVNILLAPDATALDEVMVVAYGTVRRESYSGAASVMRAERLQDVPVIGFEQALQGNLTGVQMSNTSGLPGAFPEIRIRGVGSMQAGNDPLYVIDGVVAISGDWSVSNTWTSAMNFLNPGDIESITVLKDAAAAALYGSRASNGVVLITTKRGRAGKTKVSFKNNIGFSNFAFNNHPLASEEDTEMLHREAWRNYGMDNPSVWASFGSLEAYVEDRVEFYYPSRKPGYGYVDWEKALFRTAISRKHELSISGGNEGTRIFLSGAYTADESVSKTRFMNRISGTANIDHKINRRISMGVNIQFAYTDQVGNQENQTWDNPWSGVKHLVPYRWPAYNPDGTYWRGWPVTNALGEITGYQSYFRDNSSYRNPLINLENQITSSEQTRVIIRPFVEMELMEGLKLKSIFSYDDYRILDKFGWLPEHANGQAYGDGYYSEREPKTQKLVSSTTLSYNTTIANNHNLSAMAGWEAEENKYHYSTIQVANIFSTSVLSTALASTVRTATGHTHQTGNLLSFISSLNYNYKSKYFLAGTYRRDGSSRLAADQRWGDFWSVSGSWRIINEQFMQGIPWLNDLRIRASHGISGTLPSSYYYHKSFYSSGSLERYGDDGGYRITSAFNPNLTWEKNESSNLAVETMVFNKIKLSVDFYNKLTTDLLMNASTASISGLTSYLRNIGNMRNRGVEIDVNVDIIKKQDVSWSVGVNWTGNKNEIVKMSFDGEKIQSTPWRREVGYSFYQYFTREYLGVEPATGRPMFARNTILPDGTLDKSVVYDARDASNVRIDGKTGDPDGYGGITTTFRYKGLSVNMMFGYAYGHFVFDQTQDTNQTDGGTLFFRSIHSEQLRRWQQPGDITDVPRRIPYTYAGYYNSTRMILPGDYLRLKNMTIAYSLPQNWVRRVSLDGVRVYASGTNLFTFTGLYFDPETPRIGGFANYNTPPVRTISFGLEINL